MALTPTLIVERRRNALVDQWKQDPLIVVQVESPQVLPVLTFLDDRGHGAGVGAVGRRSQTNTVIVSRPGARHGRQRGARGADVDAELRLRTLTYRSMKRSRV